MEETVALRLCLGAFSTRRGWCLFIFFIFFPSRLKLNLMFGTEDDKPIWISSGDYKIFGYKNPLDAVLCFILPKNKNTDCAHIVLINTDLLHAFSGKNSSVVSLNIDKMVQNGEKATFLTITPIGPILEFVKNHPITCAKDRYTMSYLQTITIMQLSHKAISDFCDPPGDNNYSSGTTRYYTSDWFVWTILYIFLSLLFFDTSILFVYQGVVFSPSRRNRKKSPPPPPLFPLWWWMKGHSAR